MTISPEDFRRDLDRAVTGPGSEVGTPLAEAVTRDVAAGRRLLRRRRAGTVVGGLALAVVATVAVTTYDGDRSPDTVAAPVVSAEDRAALARCVPGAATEAARRALRSGGEPVVRVAVGNEVGTAGVLESADGRYWADCYTPTDLGGGRVTEVRVYDSRGRSQGWGWSTTAACPLDDGRVPPDCRRFEVRWTDRLAPEVAAVRFTTNDGETAQVPTYDGFVVWTHLGALPGGVVFTRHGDTPGWDPLHRVTYLDDEGRPIAASILDGTGDPDGELVDGLPPLSDVTSLRGSVEIR